MTTEGPNTGKFNPDRLIEEGKKIYAQLQENLEKSARGKYIAIDIESHRHFIGETRDEAVSIAAAALPNVLFFIKRIGGEDTVARNYPFMQPAKSVRARFL